MYVLFESFYIILIATGIQFVMRDYIFSMLSILKWMINYSYIHVMWLYSCNQGTFCSNGCWLLIFSGYTFFKGIHSIYFISDSARVLCSFLIVVLFYNYGIWYFKGQLRHLITSNSKQTILQKHNMHSHDFTGFYKKLIWQKTVSITFGRDNSFTLWISYHHKCLGGSTCEGFVLWLSFYTYDIVWNNKFTFWLVLNLLKCLIINGKQLNIIYICAFSCVQK